MKKLLLLAFISFNIISCKHKQETSNGGVTDNMTDSEIAEVLENTTVTYSQPIYADSSDYILIPLVHKSDYDNKAYSSLKRKGKNLPNYWNIVFYHKYTGKTHLLTQDKIGIQKIYVQEEQELVNRNTIPYKILYEIKDLSYAKKDQYPNQLFSSNLNGTDFKPISPENESVVYFEIMPKTNDIFLQTIQDVNHDSIFDKMDKRVLYKATLDKNKWHLNEIIQSAERSKLQKLYLEQWESQ